MITIPVELGARSYHIHVGSNILGDPAQFKDVLDGPQVLVVSNETIARLYLPALEDALTGFEVETLLLPDGESFKTLDTLGHILDRLVNLKFGKDCTVVALGGGVVGDVAGFAASCYRRGCHYLQVPTTLLAQVDSSVGGKTAVNHPDAKNMIGAFYQPRRVIIDTQVLKSLPEIQYAAGLAEVVKYGLIRDAAFFSWLEANREPLLAREEAALRHAIDRSCRNKAEVVAEDETEQSVRAILNLGHTFGHAFEAGLEFRWLHGQAVAAGMCLAADLSVRLGWLAPSVLQRTEALLRFFGLPIRGPRELEVDQVFALMQHDKKVIGKQLRLILLKDIGHAVVAQDIDEGLIRTTIGEMREAAPS